MEAAGLVERYRQPPDRRVVWVRFQPEGGCDPDGRFNCGSMAYDKRAGAASLYRLAPSGEVEVVIDGVTISNGLEGSPDGSRAYYADTATGRVDVFDYEREAALCDRRPFVTLDAETEHPDGLTVDGEGGVWVALNGAGVVRRYSAAGVLDDVVEVPVAKVTACTFGGRELDEIYITTSQEGSRPGTAPMAGALFRASVGVRGRPVREFAG